MYTTEQLLIERERLVDPGLVAILEIEIRKRPNAELFVIEPKDSGAEANRRQVTAWSLKL
ncbi:MAG: hypothetical protein SGI88_17215 [Candidatus Hydrogenedentes bacterium]|nr:hypothetical protein [Candidatus Hydrogenedentota bacterium]